MNMTKVSMWVSNNHWGEDQISVLFHAEICVHSVKAHYIIISNKSDSLFYMLYVRNTNYSKFLLMKLCPKTDPSRITLILKVKLTFCCTRSHWGAASTALLWKSPYQQTANVSYARESESHKETADVICASWWRDHATFIDRSAMNTDNKGQKSQKKTQTWSPKMRICCLPEETQSAAHVTPTRTTRTACLMWEHHYPMTRLLLSDKLKGHSHVFAGHVVVVVKDWWDALLILGQLQTITISWYQISMARKSVNSFLLLYAELVKKTKTKTLYFNNCCRCTSMKGFSNSGRLEGTSDSSLTSQ